MKKGLVCRKWKSKSKAQPMFGKATPRFYASNPDDSADRLAIVSFGAEF